MGSLEGKVALVTGGSSGIGLATAKEFHANGAKVVITGRNEAGLETAVQQIGDGTLAVLADNSRLSDIDHLMTRIAHQFGKLDVLFINAGIFKGASIETVNEQDFDEMMD